jgi:hypothetical protein
MFTLAVPEQNNRLENISFKRSFQDFIKLEKKKFSSVKQK